MTNGFVVAGVDGSPASLAAVAWAADEARSRGLALEVLHARPLLPHLLPSRASAPELHGGVLHGVESGLARSHPGLTVRCTEVVDTAQDALLAASEEADLLVLGSRGTGGFAGLLVGSVGLHSASRAYCPVVVVHLGRVGGGGPAVPPGDAVHREVVLGVDARDPGEAPMAFAFEEAARRGARLRAVHAWNPPALLGTVALSGEERDSWQEPELELLSEALRVWRKQYPDLDVVEETLPLGPAEALVNASARAELLVVGRRPATTPYHPRLGPVAHAVLHHAAAPVAVVPHR